MEISQKNAAKLHINKACNRLQRMLGEPVDFELPDWFNKSKPYTFIKRSIYVTKKVKRKNEDDGIFCFCSSLPNSYDVCGRDCHCGLLLSSCSSGCKCGASCLNKPFQYRPVKKMKVVQTEKCGSGIASEEKIKQGEFIIEYVGEVIDDEICEERLWHMKRRGETNFYLCEINRDMVIDATFKGNLSRYINHSCSPNTEMQKWITDGETRIGIFATRDIAQGEQLTYDYQFVQFGADENCHCGAVGCRRKLGVKPNNLKLSSRDSLKYGSCEKESSPPKIIHKKVCYNGALDKCSLQPASKSSKLCLPNCIGQVIKVSHPHHSWSFAIIKRFDKYTGKHAILLENGVSNIVDLSRVEWELVTV